MSDHQQCGALCAIILTFNEERHIERCIRSLDGLCDRVIVADSFSTDSTVQIASSLGAEVHQNKWINYSTQFNWALGKATAEDAWLLRIDADEVLSPNLREEIRSAISNAGKDVNGIFVNRRMAFLGRPIRFGGVFPISVLRVFRYGTGRCEDRWMDEHIRVSGETVRLKGELIDNNLQSLSWWIGKHNSYASREVVDILNAKYQFMHQDSIGSLTSGGEASRKRWLKENVYSKMPLGLRAVIYFLYRYVLRLGFLDGKEGFAFHFLQGLWYRTLVDLKLLEVERYIESKKCEPREAIEAVLGIRL